MKFNKLIIIFLVVIFVLALVIVFFSRNIFGARNQASFGNEKINLKIADSPEERQIGLSQTNSLRENEGMIFLFDDSNYHSFWMKDMKFPIDIIFLNGEKIVTIHKNVQPPTEDQTSLPTYQPTSPSDRVIEVPAGFSDQKNVKVGDTVKISL